MQPSSVLLAVSVAACVWHRQARRFVLLPAVALAACARSAGAEPSAPPPAVPPRFELTLGADRPEARYKVGESVAFRAELLVDGQPARDLALPYQLRRDDYELVATGNLEFAEGRAELRVPFGKPSFLLLVVTLPGAAAKPVLAGAGCEPEKLAPSLPKPEDFDAFWEGIKAQCDALPPDPRLTPVAEFTDEAIETWALEMDTIGGEKLYGFFSKPRGDGPFPIYMEVHAAGVYPVRPDTGAGYARRGAMAVTLNPHAIRNDQPDSFYAEQRTGALKGYTHLGRDRRETSYFLRMFASCYRVARYVSGRPEWDGERFVVYGSSQGGGQAFATAGLCPQVSTIAANVPALCDHSGPEAGRGAGWPKLVSYKGGRADAAQLQAARYVDAMNFAHGIRARALVSAGFIDRTCPPCSVYAAFNALPGPKRMFDTPRHGHQHAPDFVRERLLFIDQELGLAP